jgi:glycosyltransferase involved in cell wall biosynthesis
VLHNVYGDPIHAKHLGLNEATGQFICFLDQDERFQSEKTIERAVEAFQCDKNLRALLSSGYVFHQNIVTSNVYASEFGDPVSFFLYNFPNSIERRSTACHQSFSYCEQYKSHSSYAVSAQKTPILADFVAGGSFVDRLFFLEQFPEIKHDYNLTPHLYSLLRNTQRGIHHIGLLSVCGIIHQCAESWTVVRRKIRWSVANGVAGSDSLKLSGLVGRMASDNQLEFGGRKSWKASNWRFSFALYSLSILWPLFDSIRLAYSRKRVGYLMHLVLTMYVLVTVFQFYASKPFARARKSRRYGQ